MRAELCIVIVLLAAQAIAKDPVLLFTYRDTVPIPYGSATYCKYCPYDGQKLSCWLISEFRREDKDPVYIDYVGHMHWHDISCLREEWLCEKGHLWMEEQNNGGCWCGWEPW